APKAPLPNPPLRWREREGAEAAFAALRPTMQNRSLPLPKARGGLGRGAFRMQVISYAPDARRRGAVERSRPQKAGKPQGFRHRANSTPPQPSPFADAKGREWSCTNCQVAAQAPLRPLPLPKARGGLGRGAFRMQVISYAPDARR